MYDPLTQYGVPYGTPYGSPYGLEIFGRSVRLTPGSWVATALAPITAGGSAAAWAALGGYKSAQARYLKYKRAWKQAKAQNKKKKAARLYKKMMKWKAVAATAAAEKSARTSAKAEKKLAKTGVDLSTMEAELSADDYALDTDLVSDADLALDTYEPVSSTPSWLPLALVGGGALLVLMMIMKK